jgi:hypothetical protein
MNNGALLVCFMLVISGAALLVVNFMGQSAHAVEVKKTIVDEPFRLLGIEGRWFPFTVPPGVSDVHLSGKVEITGGHLVEIHLYVYKNCPVTGSSSSTHQFLTCEAIMQKVLNNDNNSFEDYLPSGQKYHVVFQSYAWLQEAKFIDPLVTVSYNQ